jgi:hypothetical protein
VIIILGFKLVLYRVADYKNALSSTSGQYISTDFFGRRLPYGVLVDSRVLASGFVRVCSLTNLDTETGKCQVTAFAVT